VSAAEADKLQVKVFAAGPPHKLALDPFIPVFHDWIKHHRLPELLIDVASYAHVPQGPGVALIGHEADYYIDEAEGRPGLLYSRKRGPEAPGQRLPEAFRRALNAAVLLESEDKMSFRSDELLFRINDRLLAPPGEATFAAVRPALDAVAGRLFAGAPYALALVGDPKELFTVKLTSEGAPPVRTLLDRVGGPVAAR
jgi:hypothetical protein